MFSVCEYFRNLSSPVTFYDISPFVKFYRFFMWFFIKTWTQVNLILNIPFGSICLRWFSSNGAGVRLVRDNAILRQTATSFNGLSTPRGKLRRQLKLFLFYTHSNDPTCWNFATNLLLHIPIYWNENFFYVWPFSVYTSVDYVLDTGNSKHNHR